MEGITKGDLELLVILKKRYEEKKSDKLFNQIEKIIKKINNDKRYYSKLSSYGFSNEDLAYLM